MPALNDLMQSYYGGGAVNDAMFAFMQAAQSGGVTALSQFATGGSLVTSGVESIPREIAVANASVTSQVLRLTFFTCRKTFTAANLSAISGGTAAGATPTLVRYGLYTVAANGDITLVASTTNDTGIFAATNTQYTRAITGPSGITSYAMVAGQRYAFGVLLVTAAALPTTVGWGPPNGVVANIAPRIGSAVTGQADLPASVLNASFSTAQAAFPLGLVLP